MSTALVTDAIAGRKTGAQPRAGLAGVLYLINIAGCMFAEVFVRGRFIASGDAAATAARIQGDPSFFRLGVAAELVAVAGFLAAAAIFYDLFAPVSRSLSRLAAFFGIAEGAIHSLNVLNQLAPLVLLGSALPANAFTSDQLQGLAYAFLRLRLTGFHVCMVFFGLYFLTIGYLTFVSTFLPRVLGAVLALAGFSCLAGGFLALVSPASAGPLYPYFLAPFGLGRIFLALWLITKGVNLSRWDARIAEAGARR